MLDHIQEEWKVDSVISKDDLDALAADQLHSKYWRYLTEARLQLIALQRKLGILKTEKTDYFLHPSDVVAKKYKWSYPTIVPIRTKDELKHYLAIDKDILDMIDEIARIELRVAFLEDIIKKIHSRNFSIRAHIDWLKFKAGG